MKISITTDAVLVNQVIGGLKTAGENMESAAVEIGSKFLTFVRLGFNQSKDPYGLPWPKLRIRKGQILRDKSILMNSFTAQATGNSVTIGTSTPYAKYHQDGAVITPKNPGGRLRFKVAGRWYSLRKSILPPRPMLPYEPLGLPNDWEDAAGNIIIKYINKAQNA